MIYTVYATFRDEDDGGGMSDMQIRDETMTGRMTGELTLTGLHSPGMAEYFIYRGAEGSHSSPRVTWVMCIAVSSTGCARW